MVCSQQNAEDQTTINGESARHIHRKLEVKQQQKRLWPINLWVFLTSHESKKNPCSITRISPSLGWWSQWPVSSGYMKCTLLTGGRAPFRVAASACCDLAAGWRDLTLGGGWLETNGRLPKWQPLVDVSEKCVSYPMIILMGKLIYGNPMDLWQSVIWVSDGIKVWTTTNSFAACSKVSKLSQRVCQWVAVLPSTTTPMLPAWAVFVLWWRNHTRRSRGEGKFEKWGNGDGLEHVRTYDSP